MAGSPFPRLVQVQTLHPDSLEALLDLVIAPVADNDFPAEAEPGVQESRLAVAVGRVVDVRTNDYGLYLEARIRLAVNLNRLEEAWVLLQ